MELTTCQQQAADAFVNFLASDDHEFVLTGSGGCGKSFLTSHLIQLAHEHSKLVKLLTNGSEGLQIVPTATTNKAAAVLGEAVNQPADTIHSALSLRVQNDFKTGKTFLRTTKETVELENMLIIIDEASMVDTELLKIIRRYLRKCKILYVGDRYQLAPVNEECLPVFDSGLPYHELRTPVRQTKDSNIIKLAQGYRDAQDTGNFPPIFKDGVEVHHVYGADFQRMIEDEFTSNYGISSTHAKIIAWRNDTVIAYNQFVRRLYTTSESFDAGETVVANNPIIVHKRFVAKTDEEVTIDRVSPGFEENINGQWCSIRGFDVFVPNKYHEAKELINAAAKQKDWFNYFRLKEFFADLRPVHACTAHKSQGSTYDKVFIDLDDIGQCYDANTVARMLYVAISRAKKQVILYGNLPSRYLPK